MEICVINLDRAADRRKSVETQLRALDLDATFVSAVDGRDHDLSQFGRFLNVNPLLFRPIWPGEIGCFASHYRLWQECVATQRPLLVLEDDCLLDAGLKEVIAQLPGLLDSYPYIRLAGHIPRRGKLLREIAGGRSLVRLEKGPLGTVSYAIAPRAAERLIRYADVWSRPVDNYVDTFWLHGLLPIAVQPYPVQTNRFPSMVVSRQAVRLAQRFPARLSRQLCRHAHTVRRWLFKLTPAWQRAS